ncbi:hypothetical protein CDAR_396061 [Caerostris darwini]|uniref:Uncharacterized protein n=1 Tax=Caerostris darwini TaxID=1538125 RepID=A0AAV4WNG4_9ARAC|nr:hypothetical protein CDAR_396061 [Caerostris darwini]
MWGRGFVTFYVYTCAKKKVPEEGVIGQIMGGFQNRGRTEGVGDSHLQRFEKIRDIPSPGMSGNLRPPKKGELHLSYNSVSHHKADFFFLPSALFAFIAIYKATLKK